ASLVAAYLEREGYGVVSVGSGAEALQVLEREPVRLVVLDLALPDIDGLEVCRQIRTRSSVPVVMLTARDDPPDRLAGLAAGADDYIGKPFSPLELVARMKAVLRRAESGRSAAPATKRCNHEPAAARTPCALLRSLRAREFAAIAIAVLASVGVTLILAVVLVRRSVQHEALKALARQAALVATQQPALRAGQQPTSLGVFFETQQERLAILPLPQAAILLPPAGSAALRAGRPAQGLVEVGGRGYLYAARPDGQRAIVLLRAAKLEASDWHPFTIPFAIAATVGAA